MLKKGGEQTNMWFRIRQGVADAGNAVDQMTEAQIISHARHIASLMPLVDEYQELSYDYEELNDQQNYVGCIC